MDCLIHSFLRAIESFKKEHNLKKSDAVISEGLC